MKSYQPSNGTEGEYFIDKYCMNCIHMNPNPEGEKQCDILFKTMMLSVDDDEYPKEWVYNENNEGICTSFKKWDWGNDGDPDDLDNPKAPIPVAPNQLMLFSIADEVLEEPYTAGKGLPHQTGIFKH